MSARQDYPTARELTLALGGKWNDLKRQGKCRCPAHDDANPSMEVTIGKNGKPIFCCQSQKCPQAAILAALKERGLWPEPSSETIMSSKKSGTLGPVVAKYPYRNEHGDVLFWVYRHNPKTFRQHRPDGKPGIEGIRRVIYRLDDVTEAIGADRPIFIPEGEKDVDNLWAKGIPATCNPMGAGKWQAEYSQLLADADVVILPDNDDSGREHAADVATSLAGVAKRIRVLTLPDLSEKGDVSDWFDAGGTVEDLLALAEQTSDWSADQGDTTPEAIKEWPIMESRATHGIVGRIARLATENSEADPVAVIGTAIAYAAAALGRARCIYIGDSIHHSRHFNAIVGESSRARKGTSFNPVQRIFRRAEEIMMEASTLAFPCGLPLQVTHGPMSSGEGLVWTIRDEVTSFDKETGEETVVDEGVADKRLLVAEQELGSAFAAFQRAGNNLSMIIRMAYDGGKIAPLTKNNKTVATDPHICIVGHITIEELKSSAPPVQFWNGLANRFQWLLARRPKHVPFPTPMPDEKVEEIARELATVIRHAHENPDVMPMSNAAQDHWCNIYAELTQDHPGILGAVTSRQEAHARRLALTYAQLDGADRIEIDHIEAALAFTRYAFDCANYLFGDTEMDPVAERIVQALADAKRDGQPGLTQTAISSMVFGRNVPAAHLAAALAGLHKSGRVEEVKQQSKGGRPATLWRIPSLRRETKKGGGAE